MAYKSYRPEDFEAVVTKHENRLYRAALAITGNMSDDKDAEVKELSDEFQTVRCIPCKPAN